MTERKNTRPKAEGKFLKAFLDGDIDETPEEAKRRVTQLTRNADAVAKKIEKLYGVTSEQPECVQNLLNKKAQDFADGWGSPEAKLHVMPEEEIAIKNAIAAAAVDYFKAFTIFEKLTDDKPDPSDSKYQDVKRDDLYKIYANHITNAAEARLSAAGLDALTAHDMNRYVIGRALAEAHETIDSRAHIKPQQTIPLSERSAAGQISRLRDYWINLSENIHTAVNAKT